MKVLVYYHSQTGNTKKVAEVMAQALGCRAEPVSSTQGPVAADILFLGGAVYATHDHDIHPELERFIQKLDPTMVKQVVVFATGFKDQNIEQIQSRVASKGIRVSSASFFCKGKFTLFNLGHPNQEDLDRARAFAEERVK